MTLLYSYHARRQRRNGLSVAGPAGLLGLLILIAAVVFVAGCGSSGQTSTPSTQASGQRMQVMVAVTRGDLVDTVMAQLHVTAVGHVAKGEATVEGSNATRVAAGQSVGLVFFDRSTMGQQQDQGSPPPGWNQGSPPPGEDMRRGKRTNGTVTSVKTGSDGSVTAMIAIEDLPSGITKGDMGMASIAVEVLAKDALILPSAAIQGSGSNATVQVLVNGKTERRQVVVGKQTQMESEIVSGLKEGDNVIYTRTFQGFGSPRPGRSGWPQGAPPSDFPMPNGT